MFLLMNMFYLLGNIIHIYSWVCIIRIILSWSPNLLMNPLGQFVCEACDPYLMFFRRFKFTQIAGLDFSPIIALGALSLLQNICFSMYLQGSFSILGLIVILLSSLWKLVKFFLNLFVFIAFLRFILDFSYKYSSSMFCIVLDRLFSPLKSFIMRYFLMNNWKKERVAFFIIFLFFLFLRVGVELVIKNIFPFSYLII